jgi:ribosomal protein L21E
LGVAARNEHRIILTIPTAELHGETGEVIGEQDGLLRVAFSSDQAKRMLRRIQAAA